MANNGSAGSNQRHQSPIIILPHYHKAVLAFLKDAIQPKPVYVHTSGGKNKTNSPMLPTETYQTNITGDFNCATCPNQSWESGRVAIVIWRFPVSAEGGQGNLGNGLGYNATIYNQRCRVCKQLGVMWVNKEVYVERVAYRLKKWAGVRAERPPFNGDKQTPPHKTELCEGCKRGVCPAVDGS